MPIQSGYYATPFSQNPIVMPFYPNAPYNILAEEGMYPDLELLSLGCSGGLGRISQIQQEKAQSTKLARWEQRWALVLSHWQVKLCNEWVALFAMELCARLTGKMGISGAPLTQWAIGYCIHLASADRAQPYKLLQNPCSAAWGRKEPS